MIEDRYIRRAVVVGSWTVLMITGGYAAARDGTGTAPTSPWPRETP